MQCGPPRAAHQHFSIALPLARNPTERRFIEGRINAVQLSNLTNSVVSPWDPLRALSLNRLRGTHHLVHSHCDNEYCGFPDDQQTTATSTNWAVYRVLQPGLDADRRLQKRRKW